MSLVNDMLKDLDARRRGAPVNGNAAKKLTPASDSKGRTDRVRLPLIAGVIFSIAVALLILWLLLNDTGRPGQLTDLDGGRESVSSATSSVAQNTQLSLSDDAGSGINSSDNSAGSSAGNSADVTAVDDSVDSVDDGEATIAALEARIAELESANSAATTPRNVGQSQQAGDWQPVDWGESTEPTDQADANEVAGTASSDADASLLPSNRAEPPTGTAVERHAREMPLSERDRLRVQEALTQWSQGQQLNALQLLDSFAYENPEAHQSRETLAKLLIQQGEVERALQVAEAGLQVSPSHPGYRKVKARILLGQSNVPQALSLLSAGPPSVANDPEYHNLLATAQLAGGQYTGAIESYRSLLRLADPRLDAGPLWYGLGSAYLRTGNAAEARQAYQQALQQPELSANLRAQIERRLAAPAPAQ